MLEAKLIYFVAAFILVVCATDFEIIAGEKRSAVCLVEQVAVHNHITAKYEKVQHGEQKNRKITCKLELGNEQYVGNSSSKSVAKAKEKVARQAYALTKYTKPPIENRTCILHTPPPAVKSDISLLEEYGHVVGNHMMYSEVHHSFNGSFEYVARLGDKSASGLGYKKKTAKNAAATNLVETIGRSKVVDALRAKYNDHKYHDMDPKLRLRKILRITDLSENGDYTKESEHFEHVDGKGQTKRIIAKLTTNDFMAAGTGSTFEEASSNAAANLLRTMNYTVTWSAQA